MFVHGCDRPENEVRAHAYHALRAPNTVEPRLGLDQSQGQVRIEDVRSLPIDRDEGYATVEQSGQARIQGKDMIYLIVDNRDQGKFHTGQPLKSGGSRAVSWWGHTMNTDVLWITANLANGLWGVPYYWAGVFVLEVARFMYPQQHFGLVDNDCVPVTLFEVPDLVALATSQMQWIDLVGMAPDDPRHNDKVGLLLVTEARLEYNGHFDRQPMSPESSHQSI